jgi:hypothetical protein
MWSGTSSSSPASPTTREIPSTPSYKLKHQGRRVAQIVKLKPECVEKYKECHAKVWPEVLKQIKECNIEDCEFRAACDPFNLACASSYTAFMAARRGI